MFANRHRASYTDLFYESRLVAHGRSRRTHPPPLRRGGCLGEILRRHMVHNQGRLEHSRRADRVRFKINNTSDNRHFFPIGKEEGASFARRRLHPKPGQPIKKPASGGSRKVAQQQ